MTPEATIDSLIDRFVAKINDQPRRRIRAEDLPPELRQGAPEFGLYYHWRIQPFANTQWIRAVEAILERPLPAAYRSLVTRYVFPAFECGPLLLLANTGQSLYHEMSAVLLRNQATFRSLQESGYVQFARLLTGDADPVCFAYDPHNAATDPRIVRVHQTALLNGSGVEVVEHMADSFGALIERTLQNDPQPTWAL